MIRVFNLFFYVPSYYQLLEGLLEAVDAVEGVFEVKVLEREETIAISYFLSVFHIVIVVT